MKLTVDTSKAPKPIGPYSQAVFASKILFISGQIPLNPETNQMENKDIQAETK